ncbi:MAG: nucleotidyltransferase [Candidatus Roizmanbacteria bacterium]|nr:nucleotidyltransferase [Candidatus Roizmanbacteria bacterium]
MNIQRLLRSLLEHKVKFLIIGAWALPAYGYERMTRDIDIFIKPTRLNAERTISALKSIGYDIVEDLKIKTLLTKKILLRQYILQIDIHPFVAGIGFDNAWKNRVETEIKGVNVYVPSIEDIIKMKEAAGRGKDKIDLEVLKEIQKRLRNK